MNQNAQSANGYNVPTTANPIPQAMGSMGTAIHELSILTDTLANRLCPVLMPMQDSAAGKGVGGNTLAAAPPPISPQTDEINSLRRRVENITAQVQDVLNRLEV